MEEQTAKPYEISFLLRSEEGTGILAEQLNQLQAEIFNEGETKEIRLSYPIDHLESAYFGYIHFNLLPSLISELKAALKLKNQILRFLIVTPPFLKDKDHQSSLRPARIEKQSIQPSVSPEAKPEGLLSNDALEEKLEEILNK